MMTIEEKAKAYDEALEKAKKRVTTEPQDHTDAVLKDIFPQLKESEDERIRKGLIQHLKELRNWKVGTMTPIKVAAHYDAWIAYLEKQNDANKEYWRGYREGKQEILDKYAEIEKQKEQKPAEWSEDDENAITTAIRACRYMTENFENSTKQYEDAMERLKSLRSQPKQEWSKEDEKVWQDIFDLCNRFGYDDACRKLKSLRPQPAWKPSEQEKGALRTAICVLTEERNFPKTAGHLQAILDAFEGKESRKGWKLSDEQMDALSDAYVEASTFKNGDILESLYNDLEKL